MKILISTSSFGKHDESTIKLLKENGMDIVFNPFGRKLSEQEAKEMYQNMDGVIAGTEEITEGVLSTARNLKVISRCGSGVDNVDQTTTQKLGIKVFTTPKALTQAVAELTIGLIIDILRHISNGDRSIRNGKWEKKMGNLLYGKTLGFLGLGRIGKRIVELLAPFSVKCIARDIAPNMAFAQKHSLRYCDLDDILVDADIVSLHLPYEPKLHHIIGPDELGRMKQNAILINASRGGLVDEEALYQALADKRIAGAAIDTFMQEPYTGPLKDLENVILTPHIGSYATEARNTMEYEAAINLIQGLK